MRLRIRKGGGRETSCLIHLRIRVDDADFFMYCKLWSLCDVIRIQNGEGGATKMRGGGGEVCHITIIITVYLRIFLDIVMLMNQ